jgi:hypothetical protein
MNPFPVANRKPPPRRGSAWLRAWGVGLVLVLGAASLPAQTTREYDLKAVFLFNFTQFAEWPAEAFESPDQPFVIGVLGDDPFGPVLEAIVQNERANGRPLTVRRFQFADQVRGCQILFIGRSHRGRYDREINAWHGRHILTVADGDLRIPAGWAVEFLTSDSRIRLRINTGAVGTAGVSISSKLLRLAELVGDPR